MTDQKFDLRPLAGALGAEVRGLDLSHTLDASVVSQLHDAWLKHQVLFFRDQTLTPPQFKAFASLFGKPEILPFIPPELRVKEEPDIEIFEQTAWMENAPPTDTIHIDVSSRDIPSKAAVLFCLETPEAGGDTIWVNMYDAYDHLSDSMKKLLTGKTATFPKLDFAMVERFISAEPAMKRMLDMFWHPPINHPVVHTHPETGRSALFVDPFRTRHINDLENDESDAILRFLRKHIAKPEFQCRWNWDPRSVCIWDNRCTAHKRIDDHFDGRRLFHRVSIAAEEPPRP